MRSRTKRQTGGPSLLGERLASGARGSRGSILLEIVVATLLLTLLIVPLAEGLRSAVERGRSSREWSAEHSAAWAAGDSGQPGGEDPWIWSVQVVEGRWRPGPVLHLRAAGPAAEGDSHPLTLGVWVDGWYAQEEPIVPGVPLSIDQAAWQGISGRELVLRLRVDGGAWGPPWRTQVPGVDGSIVAGSSPDADAGAQAEADDPAVVIVHMAHMGTLIPVVTAGGQTATPLTEAAPLLFPADDGGWWRAEADGRSQCWRMEPERALDVYF